MTNNTMADAELPEYEYHSLRKDRQEIRLLELQPAAKQNDLLRCTIRHKPLSSATLMAVSYVWGDQDHDRADIVINYKHGRLDRVLQKVHLKARRDAESTMYRKSIGSSLGRALRHLRKRDVPVTLWADSLCINQEDKEEKTWQVQLMTQIYSNATVVHAWLGPTYKEINESPDIVKAVNRAFDCVDFVASRIGRYIPASRLTDDNTWLTACFDLSKASIWDYKQQGNDFYRLCAEAARGLRDALASSGLLLSYLSALKTMSRTAYFSRVWIVQEAGKARALRIHYGQRSASHTYVFLALCFARGLCASETSPTMRSISLGFDSRYFSCLTARRVTDLISILELAYLSRASMHEAGDPRDLIFALLGLVKGPIELKVDCSLGTEEVYVMTAQALLRRGFTDLLIALKPYSVAVVRSKEILHLPSWAFDWRTKDYSPFKSYAACGKTKPQLAFLSSPHSKYPEVLRINGVGIGRITAVGDKLSVVAKSAGFSSETDWTSIKRDQRPLSAEDKQKIKAEIVREHRELGLNATDADIENLFANPISPIASFWRWWIQWSSAAYSFSRRAVNRQPDGKLLEDLLELLIRVSRSQGFVDLAIPRNIAAARNFRELIDLKLWSKGVEAVRSLFRHAWGMRLVALDSTYVAYAPEATEIGDEVVVFHGVKAPLVIRRCDERGHRVVGPAYVCRAMQGQLVGPNAMVRTFQLV